MPFSKSVNTYDSSVVVKLEGIEKGIRGMIGALRDFGHGDAEIELAIVKNYGLSEAEAREYL